MKLEKSQTKSEDFKVKSVKKFVPKVIAGIFIFLAAIFLLRVSLWERSYYNEKEGSERAVSPSVGDMSATQEVDETPVTEEQVYEHIVAAEKPRYISIPKLGITNSRVFELGTVNNGQLATPYNIFDTGWYKESGLPGGNGVGIYDGHSGGPTQNGIFRHLDRLEQGDQIIIETGDGAKYTYQVYDNKQVDLSQADKEMQNIRISPVQGVEAISIISCSGEWSTVQNTYLSRQFVRAIRN